MDNYVASATVSNASLDPTVTALTLIKAPDQSRREQTQLDGPVDRNVVLESRTWTQVPFFCDLDLDLRPVDSDL